MMRGRRDTGRCRKRVGKNKGHDGFRRLFISWD